MKKLKLILLAALAYIGLASQSSAAGINLYNAHEFDLDIFGTRVFASSDSARIFDEDANGGGLALNYFLFEWLGFGGDVTLLESSGDTNVIATGGATFRLPLGDSGLSLSALAGMGFLFNPNEFDKYGDQVEDSDDYMFLGYAGAGAEWRLTEGFGLFADYRYNFGETSRSDYSQARLGMRFAW